MIKQNVFFTIVIAAYNSSLTLRKAVESVTTQLNEDYEIIVIDDCSTDNTRDVMNQLFEDFFPFVKIYSNETNSGPSFCRNFGISKSTGCYIGFLDADDWYVDGLFQLLKKELLENNPDIIKFGVHESYKTYCRSVKFPPFFVENKREIAVNAIKLEEYPLFGYAANSFYNCSLLKRHNLKFDTELSFAEDFFFNINFFQICKTFQNLSFIGYHYSKDQGGSLSSRYIENYQLLYERKIENLLDWALSNDCLGNCSSSLARIYLRTVYSSVVRQLERHHYSQALESINYFTNHRLFSILLPYMHGSNFPLKVAILPVKLKQPLLLFLFSLSFLVIKKFFPEFSKRL